MTELSISTSPDHVPFAGVLRSRLYRPDLQVALKELLEPVLSAIALVVLSPIMGLLCLLIRLDSPGPAIFAQQRLGRFGSPFTMYKLRTMKDRAEQAQNELLDRNEAAGPVFKIKDDPRVTRLGRWLRRTGLDEAPQLLNVLMGDMSLVGPRPPLPREVDHYEQWHIQRLAVRPGLTCLWQVSPDRHSDFHDWMRLDLEYIEHWSLGLDLKVLLQTVSTVLRGRGY